MLQQPVAQMRDFITDALRSSIPVYTLDEVFAKKDDIAQDVNATVSEQMAPTASRSSRRSSRALSLPAEVRGFHEPDQRGAAHQGGRAGSRRSRSYPPRYRAKAEAEAMEKAGEGIANQRKAIAVGIKTRSRRSKRPASPTTRRTSCSCIRSGPR